MFVITGHRKVLFAMNVKELVITCKKTKIDKRLQSLSVFPVPTVTIQHNVMPTAIARDKKHVLRSALDRQNRKGKMRIRASFKGVELSC